MEWTTPRNVSEVRCFMGLGRYYRRFIEGFLKLAPPIISLQKKGVKFVWTANCEDNFQRLEEILTSVVFLKIVILYMMES